MNAVVDLKEYALRKSEALVLVDLLDDLTDSQAGLEPIDGVLSKCRIVLSHCRGRGSPVAFVRRRADMGQIPRGWQTGFIPQRSEMLFERKAHSCYASEPFSAMVDAAGGRFALAGFFGETSCVATMIDAVNRGHHVTFLSDASHSQEHGGLSASEMHKAITSILALHGAVTTAREWMGTH